MSLKGRLHEGLHFTLLQMCTQKILRGLIANTDDESFIT